MKVLCSIALNLIDSLDFLNINFFWGILNQRLANCITPVEPIVVFHVLVFLFVKIFDQTSCLSNRLSSLVWTFFSGFSVLAMSIRVSYLFWFHCVSCNVSSLLLLNSCCCETQETIKQIIYLLFKLSSLFLPTKAFLKTLLRLASSSCIG